MKKFLLMFAAVATLFTACNKECEHDFIEVDHSKDIVGTWTCLETDYASALVFTADGSAISMGVGGDEYWENIDGNYSIKNNNLLISFESGYNVDVRIDLIPNEYLSIVDKDGNRHTYHYCANDLSDEIVGMWVATTGPYMSIEVFNEDGSAIYTGFVPESEEMAVTSVTSYKVVGDLQFHTVAEDDSKYVVHRLIYSPSSITPLGEIMTWQVDENISFPRLRIKQTLDLPGKKYDYIKTFITNVKGLDKDIEFMGTTFNFAKMDGVKLDKMLKTLLFTVEFPDANTIKYGCHYNNQPMSMEAPIAVDGNKMTVKMSQKNPALKDVDLYTFQDQDNTQMHMYMHSTAFVNFFGNMQVTIMEQLGQLDTTDASAVKAVFDSIDEAVETINVSFVMTRAK